MKRPNITCPKCDGTGKVPLSDELFSVLSVVKKHRRIDATKVHRLLCKQGVIVSAMNNRLEDLRELGFVLRTKHGRQWFYLPTGKRAQ